MEPVVVGTFGKYIAIPKLPVIIISVILGLGVVGGGIFFAIGNKPPTPANHQGSVEATTAGSSFSEIETSTATASLSIEVTFMVEGSVWTTVTVSQDSTVTPPARPEVVNKEFLGWSEETTVGATSGDYTWWNFEAQNVTQPITLSAVFRDVPSAVKTNKAKEKKEKKPKAEKKSKVKKKAAPTKKVVKPKPKKKHVIVVE